MKIPAVIISLMVTDIKQLDDMENITDVSIGNDGCFSEVVDRYRDRLCRFIRRYISRQDMVEDVFQETIMQLFISRKRFDSSKPLSPWLFTIAANKAKDALRKQRLRAAVNVGTIADSWDSSCEKVYDTISTSEQTPLDNIQTKEHARIVHQIIATLPEKAREILILVYFDRYSYKQTAEILTIPIGTVKSRLNAAVVTFAKQWRSRLNDS